MIAKEMIKNHMDQTEIPCIISIPEGVENIPAVILCHGTGSDKDEVGQLFIALSDALMREGIASFRFDFRGNGESVVDYIEYSLSSATSDTVSVFEEAVSNSMIDSNRIGILGFSQGATIALLSAAKINKSQSKHKFKTLVSWSGAPNLKGGLITEDEEKIAIEQGYVDLNFDFRDSLKLSKQWVEEVNSIRVLEEYKGIDIPTLAIAGVNDQIVPYENAKKIIEASGSDDAKELLFECDHILNVFENKEISTQIINETVRWLKEKL